MCYFIGSLYCFSSVYFPSIHFCYLCSSISSLYCGFFFSLCLVLVNVSSLCFPLVSTSCLSLVSGCLRHPGVSNNLPPPCAFKSLSYCCVCAYACSTCYLLFCWIFSYFQAESLPESRLSADSRGFKNFLVAVLIKGPYLGRTTLDQISRMLLWSA